MCKLKERPILYRHFRDKMDEHADVGIKTISYHKARWVISRFMIPKKMRMNVIKEMTEMGLLYRINKGAMEIKW